jgi:hypothetical protein
MPESRETKSRRNGRRQKMSKICNFYADVSETNNKKENSVWRLNLINVHSAFFPAFKANSKQTQNVRDPQDHKRGRTLETSNARSFISKQTHHIFCSARASAVQANSILYMLLIISIMNNECARCRMWNSI